MSSILIGAFITFALRRSIKTYFWVKIENGERILISFIHINIDRSPTPHWIYLDSNIIILFVQLVNLIFRQTYSSLQIITKFSHFNWCDESFKSLKKYEQGIKNPKDTIYKRLNSLTIKISPYKDFVGRRTNCHIQRFKLSAYIKRL